MDVLRDADDAARHLALVLVARGHERRVRAAVAHRHAEALRVADDDVRTELGRRAQERQREQVTRDRDERTCLVRRRAERRQVVDPAVGLPG